MALEIRPVKTQAEYRAVEQLQREVWGMPDVEIVDHSLLLTAHKNGGLVLAAFDEALTANEGMVGFVFSFIGLQPDGRPKHCSHLAAVLPAYQGQNIGYRLKVAQHDYVLAQGLELITWTFDPLESRNAHLNFHKLGVTCNTFLPNLYGQMRDSLNVGLPSDRFQVDWYIGSQHVAARLAGDRSTTAPSAWLAEGVPMFKLSVAGDLPDRIEAPLSLTGERLLVQTPTDFRRIRTADMNLARAWREFSGAIFGAAFNQGYTATDFLVEDGQGYYLLELNWSIS